MAYFLFWYLTITLLGWLTFPLAYRLLPGLPDRGYAFVRTLGWLLWGYVFWLLASLGVLRNDLGGLFFALLLLLALSLWAWRSVPAGDLRGWLNTHGRLVLAVELLFLAAFAGLALVRAANPNIEATEKPMELAFINAILHSPTFPPHDPWLSGYAISYYYFGYVLVSLLARLTGTPGEFAFNLGISLVFALSALGAYGVVYNLYAKWSAEGQKTTDDRRQTKSDDLSSVIDHPSSTNRRPSTIVPLLGPLFILMASNLEGFLEVLHARGLFWRVDPATGERVSAFWTWLGIKDLVNAPAQPLTWLPSRFLWWWRASRVVQDLDLHGNPIEIIDEFPVFSYLLADLHPHVLAMPFAFLAMALALNLFLGGSRGRIDRFRLRFRPWTLLILAVLVTLGGLALLWFGITGPSARLGLAGLLGIAVGGFVFTRAQPALSRSEPGPTPTRVELGWSLFLSPAAFMLAAVVLGGLGFLNTWDFPFYVALFAGAYALRRHLALDREIDLEAASRRSSVSTLIGDFLWLAIILGIAGVLAYLPFYLGFSSQASGILPNLVNPTRGAQLWVMFGTLLLPIGAYLIYLWRTTHAGRKVRHGFTLALAFFLGLWVLSLLLGLAITFLPNYGDLLVTRLGAPDRITLLLDGILRRLSSPGGWLILLGLLAVTLGLILKGIEDSGVVDNTEEEQADLTLSTPIPHSPIPLSSSHLFSLLLILLGALLVTGPEFFFLLDLFGTRMNTIFKFYYQAWLLWGVAAAFGTAVLLSALKRLSGLLFSLGLAVVLVMALTYTVLGLWDKTNRFKPPMGWTLDGTAYLALQSPDDFAAARWLQSAPPGVLAEAVGGSYTAYARLSMLSGQPAVLGWDFHEVQWGHSNQVPSRKADMERLYCTRSSQEAQGIIDRYKIRYIAIGNLERATYQPGQGACQAGLNEARFRHELNLVFQQGDTAIYAVP